MPLVFVGEIGLSVVWLLWVYCDASYEISVTVGGAQYVFPSWGKNSLFRVVGMKDNGQLGVVNPPLSPVDLWLVGSEPWVS